MTDFLHKLSAHTFKTGCQFYSRIGHRAILKGSNILVFGGTNYHNQVITEILNINCESYEVNVVRTKNTVPIECFSLHQFDNKIFIWGGKRTSGGNKYVSNELWKLQNYAFTKVIQKGFIPSPRMCHNSVIFSKKYMIIYGGLSDTQIFNDWYALDLETYQWKKLSCNFTIPTNLQSKMVWLETRGMIFVSQAWKDSKIEYCCDLYQFKIRIKQNNLLIQLEKIEIQYLKPLKFRGSPTFCKYNADCLCVAIIGGQKFAQNEYNTNSQIFSDCWIVNLQTYQCSKAEDVQLTAKYGHQAVFYKDRILLIGGICSTGQLSSFLQTIDNKLKFISIDRKLCQACKCVYGLEDFTKHKFSIKCEYQSKQTSYIPAKLVKKFAEVIQNPIKAFGLLIDNSLNMNANMIEINLKKLNLDQKIYKKSYQTILQLTDNSYGFNKDEILQSLFTFGYKIQTCTHDSKFEQQLAVRKQYGLNLKLSSMRLGRSCLILVNTIQDERFIGYFSIDPTSCPQFKDRFNCFYYFINNDKFISSQINRHIIKKNIQHLIDIDEFQKGSSAYTNKIIILDFNHNGQLLISDTNNNLSLQQSDEEGIFFQNLKMYLKHLYLKPYVGRKIKLYQQIVQCQSLIQRLKKQQNQGKLKKIDFNKYTDQAHGFQIACLYNVLDKQYENKKVIIYSLNRLIGSIDFSNQMICGVIDLKSDVQIGIGKCSIQSRVQQKQLRRYILTLKQQINPKRTHSSMRQLQEESIRSLNNGIKKRK